MSLIALYHCKNGECLVKV
uniref:Uncharacterized protein n=1 Tax=Arundo donax TaxID=35708 RepID=A0A0A9BLU4_ARUDO